MKTSEATAAGRPETPTTERACDWLLNLIEGALRAAERANTQGDYEQRDRWLAEAEDALRMRARLAEGLRMAEGDR